MMLFLIIDNIKNMSVKIFFQFYMKFVHGLYVCVYQSMLTKVERHTLSVQLLSCV